MTTRIIVKKTRHQPYIRSSDPGRWILARQYIVNRLNLFSLLFFLLFPVFSSSADQASEVSDFTNFLLDIKTSFDQLEADKDTSYRDIFMQSCDFPEDDSILDADIIEEQRELKLRDRGVELRGGLSSGSSYSGDNEENSFENSRGYLELSWDVLKNGYLENRSEAEALDLLARKTELGAVQKSIRQQFQCRYRRINKDFAGLRLSALGIKLRLMEQVFKVERRAYFKQWSYLEDYLVSEQDLALIRQELDTLVNDPYYDNPVLTGLPPIVTVDLQGLLASVRNDEYNAAALNLNKDYLEKEADSIFHDSLRFYLRKDIEELDGFGSSDNFTAGLSFRVPIKKRETGMLGLKLQKLEQENRVYQYDRLYRCREAYDSLLDQLKRTITQQYRHERAKERLRRSMILIESGEDQSLTVAITRMKTCIEAWIELIDATEELYRRVNSIFMAAQIPYDSSLVSKINLVPELKRARPGQRSIYLWSDDFNRLSNMDIIRFLETKQITTVLLSGSSKTDTDKRTALIKQLSAKNINVELIIGDNTWIFEHKQKQAVEKTVLTSENTETIHFDIEPQAMEGYRENKDKYISLYLELLAKVREGMLDRKLTAAVPFHWTENVYRELGNLTDKIYIMAYGTDKPDVLLRRIEPALKGVGPDKLAVALRPKDFKDEWAMENVISTIQEQTGIENFAFHDLGQFIDLAGSSNEIKN